MQGDGSGIGLWGKIVSVCCPRHGFPKTLGLLLRLLSGIQPDAPLTGFLQGVQKSRQLIPKLSGHAGQKCFRPQIHADALLGIFHTTRKRRQAKGLPPLFMFSYA